MPVSLYNYQPPNKKTIHKEIRKFHRCKASVDTPFVTENAFDFGGEENFEKAYCVDDWAQLSL
jgi:hypothetical protein